MQVPGARKTGGKQADTCINTSGTRAREELEFSKSLLVNLRLLS